MSALDRVLALASESGDYLGDEDRSDWNEDDWDDVRSHLEQESPWFRRVMGGESPGDPDAGDTALSRILALTPHTAEASTVHEPTVPPGGPGLFRIHGRQLPPYVQHLYKHLVAKYGKHRAYGVAIGIVKKWAAGINPGGKGKGHKVHADVQAAAAKNVADWEASKGMAHAHHGAKEARHDDKAAASNTALSRVLGAAEGRPAVPFELAAPASWPSGKPYKDSFLPPGPATSLLAGQATRPGVITNAPGSPPVRQGQLRQAPSQTVSAPPPLPSGVTLPAPKDIDALVAQVPDGTDITLSNSVRTHLRTAAGKLRADDRIGALSALRSAQAGIHAAYRAAYNENIPRTSQVYSFVSVPPAEQSSARTEMLAGRAVTEKYRALHHQVATWIDQFRRDYFGLQFNQTPYARFAHEPPAAAVALAQVKSYERENRFGRIVNVHNYIREGKPYAGRLVGDEADEAIRAGVAEGEFGEPTGYFQTSDGKKMWGWYGAAGVLVRHTDPQTGEKRYLLQKRAPWVDAGNTYSIPGGAIDHTGGKPETPEQAAHREAREELGRDLPAGTKLAEIRTKTFGEGKGAWSYHTVIMDTPQMFSPEGRGGLEGVHDTRREASGHVWATPHEMADLPLHPHFRATAEELGMPAGGGTEPPKLSAGEIAEGLVRLVTAGADYR